MGNKLGYPKVDLSGKVAIVTGGNTGIGYETAKGLARLGTHTFIACRSKERAEEAIERMKGELAAVPGQSQAEGGGEGGEQRKEVKLEYLPLDLSSFQSTTDFVRAFKEKGLPLHILVNNAALCGTPYSKTADGFESQFQVNHLSHMLMTLELLPLLVETASQSGDVRIVNVSSYAHQLAQAFDPTTLNRTEQNYTRASGYNNSKLYNVMTSFALQRRLPGKNITVSSLHPGYVQTELSRGFKDMKALSFLQDVSVKVLGRKPDAGAATTLNCAVNPDLNSQQHFYYDSCQPKQCSADARNVEFQEELWRRSLEFLKDHLSRDVVEKYGPNPEAKGGVAPEAEGGVAPKAEGPEGVVTGGGDQQHGNVEATTKPSEDPAQADTKDSEEAPASEEGSMTPKPPSEDPSQTNPKDSGEGPASSGDQLEKSVETTPKPSEETAPKASSESADTGGAMSGEHEEEKKPTGSEEETEERAE